jgi:hypothetical protein
MVRDMLFDLSFKANWKNIKERKMAWIEDSNQRENAKQISHTYPVRDLVSKHRNQLQLKLHRPRDGPHVQLIRSTQMVHLRYVKELRQRKFLFVE